MDTAVLTLPAVDRASLDLVVTDVGHRVRSHLAWAVVCTLLCFAPVGVVAVVHAARVRPLLAVGDLAGARRESRSALVWCLLSGACTAFFVLVLVTGADGFVASSGS